MRQKLRVFDDSWLAQARVKKPEDSWVDDLMTTIDNGGNIYLSTLRTWFDRFPISSNKQKRGLKARLESFKNEDHLGAVNELSWYEFMQQTGSKAAPLAVSKTPRPDFKVENPTELFCEVSTLNVSDDEKKKFEDGEAVELNHRETLRRILLKVMTEKQHQISYAANQKRPCLLVLFDYTTWSAFGTQFFRFLADFLLGQKLGFADLPAEVSALGYVERKVMGGRIALGRDRSAIYHNPNAKYPLPLGAFATLNQFTWQMVEVKSKTMDHWIWL